MSQFNLFFTDVDVNEKEVVANATTFNIHLEKETKTINGKRIAIFNDLYGATGLIGVADDYHVRCSSVKTIEQFLEFLRAHPKRIEEIKNSPDYCRRLAVLTPKVELHNKRMNEMNDILDTATSEKEVERIQKEIGYYEFADSLILTKEESLIWESAHFNAKAYKQLVSGIMIDDLRHIFNNIKAFANWMISEYGSLNIIHYEEHGMISDTKLTTTIKKIKIDKLSIEDLAFLQLKEQLQITK